MINKKAYRPMHKIIDFSIIEQKSNLQIQQFMSSYEDMNKKKMIKNYFSNNI